MSKQILPRELAAVTATLLTRPDVLGELDTADQYQSFINDIACVLTEHCGGSLNAVHPPMEGEKIDPENPSSGAGQYLASISPDESLPSLTANIWSFFDPEGWIDDDPNDAANPRLLSAQDAKLLDQLLHSIAGVLEVKVSDHD